MRRGRGKLLTSTARCQGLPPEPCWRRSCSAKYRRNLWCCGMQKLFASSFPLSRVHASAVLFVSTHHLSFLPPPTQASLKKCLASSCDCTQRTPHSPPTTLDKGNPDPRPRDTMADGGGDPPPGSLRLLKSKMGGSGRAPRAPRHRTEDGARPAAAAAPGAHRVRSASRDSHDSGRGSLPPSSGDEAVEGEPSGPAVRSSHESHVAASAARGGREPEIEVKTKRVVVWRCQECDKACIPVRDESRCLW